MILGMAILARSLNSAAFAGPTEKITTLAPDAKIDSVASGFERIRSSFVRPMYFLPATKVSHSSSETPSEKTS
jgi:hypothetical protein